MKQTVFYAWRELWRHKGRSLWNLMGYALAVAFLVITLSATISSRIGAGKALQYTGAQFIGFIYASAGDTTVTFHNHRYEGSFIYNNPVSFFPGSLVDLVGESPHVRHAAPLLTFTMITDPYVNRSWILAGFDPLDMESVRMVGCSHTDLIGGRLIQPGDTGVVLLEQTFADAEQYRVDDMMWLGEKEYRVIGILSPGTRPAKADIYMPLEEARMILNTRIRQPVKDVVNVVLVDGTSALLMRNAIMDVKEILGFNSSTIGYGCFNPAGQAIGITARGMRMLGILVFVSIILLVFASQYFAVVERGNDIGILKAIGWTENSIVWQVVAESIIMAAAGGLAGSMLASILFSVFPVDRWLGLGAALTASLDVGILLMGWLLTILAGALAGALSAFMSVRLKPAQILRRLN
jgi:putative ABC transport system permease protein